MKKYIIALLISFLLVSNTWAASTIYRHLEPETVTQITRIYADGGTVIDQFYMNQVIKTLKHQGIYSSCKFLADANMGVKKDGAGAVSLFYDISGNNNDAVQATGANQPIWTAAQQNGKSGLVFTGSSSQYLSVATAFTKAANFTIITAAIVNDVAVTQWIHGSANAVAGGGTRWAEFGIKEISGGDLWGYVSDGTFYLRSLSAAGILSNLTATLLTQTYTNGDNHLHLWKNGSPLATTEEGSATSNAGTAYKFSIGRLGEYNGVYFTGKHLNTTILDAVLTTAQRQAMENLINQYYLIY